MRWLQMFTESLLAVMATNLHHKCYLEQRSHTQHVDAFCWRKASFAAALKLGIRMPAASNEQIYISAVGQNMKICCECDREKEHISWDSKVV
jgi:hypothetical protein